MNKEHELLLMRQRILQYFFHKLHPSSKFKLEKQTYLTSDQVSHYLSNMYDNYYPYLSDYYQEVMIMLLNEGMILDVDNSYTTCYSLNVLMYNLQRIKI